MDAPPRKRRDRLADAFGTMYPAGEVPPPYIFMIEDLIYLTFHVDPDRVGPFLPKGLTIADGAAGVMALRDTGPTGWGPTNHSAAWAGVVVNEHPSPDTAESVFILSGFEAMPAASLMSRHYYTCMPGCQIHSRDGDRRSSRVLDGNGQVIAETTIRLTTPFEDAASLDRYLGIDGQGRLVSWIISLTGETSGAEILALTITDAAPADWQALRPTGLAWATHLPRMMTNQSAPLPVGLPDPADTARASRQALMAVLESQGRACAILTEAGRILHLNAPARTLLPGGTLPDLGPDRNRFRAALAAACRGEPPSAPFRTDSAFGPLILQPAPLDPVLAGPGTALVMIDAPQAPQASPRGDLLQLLGLTPAEARIAAAVGAGLPPREAALRLGLAESTVRSSLKVIFGKLGLTRQAELARLIARLEV